MDLVLNAEEQAFQTQVREFLATKMPPEIQERVRLAPSYVPKEYTGRWQQLLYEQGWGAPGWPVEYGGTGWTPMQRYIYDSEAGKVGTPTVYLMGLALVGPVIMQFSTDEQKAHYLPRILSGEDIWCQGYSEPGSGSDLASLQTRAVRDGDEYVINGSKIWTTGAQHADRIFCLVRTADTEKRQEGISFLLFDMDDPGIKVEPIITLAGDHEVNQVFFDDVRVPVANRLGEENDGWTVAKYLLEFERGGSAYAAMVASSLGKLHEITAAEPAAGGVLGDDPAFVLKVAAAEIKQQAAEYTEHRTIAEIVQRGRPGPASSIMKVLGSETNQWVTELMVEAVHYYGAAYQPEARVPGNNIEPIGPVHAVPAVPKFLNFRASSIYGGSNEIQRNIVAKQVLGL